MQEAIATVVVCLSVSLSICVCVVLCVNLIVSHFGVWICVGRSNRVLNGVQIDPWEVEFLRGRIFRAGKRVCSAKTKQDAVWGLHTWAQGTTY